MLHAHYRGILKGSGVILCEALTLNIVPARFVVWLRLGGDDGPLGGGCRDGDVGGTRASAAIRVAIGPGRSDGASGLQRLDSGKSAFFSLAISRRRGGLRRA